LQRAAADAGVPASQIGKTGGSRLVIAARDREPWIDLDVALLQETWSRAIPRRLGHG
jgi:hypothetical protein